MCMRRRWAILLVMLPVYAFVLSLLSLAMATIIINPVNGWQECMRNIVHPSLSDLGDLLTDWIYWSYFGGPAILVTVTQAAFLFPVCGRRLTRGMQMRSLLLSLVMIGLVAAGLATGLFLAGAEALNLYWHDDTLNVNNTWTTWMLWLALPLGMSWGLWSLLIGLFARKRFAPSVLMRLIGWLLAGTLVEVLIVLPVDIMVRRRNDCYCGTGSAHALGLAAWAALWLAGPGAVLVVLSKRRRLWWELHCPECGYAKGPSPGARCPECGFEWEQETALQHTRKSP